MGKIYLCWGYLAKKPLWVKSAGVHLYSAQELCYFIVNYLNLIDEKFFSAEFYCFLKEELGLKELALSLEKYNPSYQLNQMLSLLAENCDYLERFELKKFQEKLKVKAQASPWELMKSRGDFLASEGRWFKAIERYTVLLQDVDKKEISDEFLGRVYTNRAMAYWQLFEFDCAVKDLERAWQYLKEEKIIKTWYFLYLQVPNSRKNEKLLEKIGKEKQNKWRIEWGSQQKEIEAEKPFLDFSALEQKIEQWKEEYLHMRS